MTYFHTIILFSKNINLYNHLANLQRPEDSTILLFYGLQLIFLDFNLFSVLGLITEVVGGAWLNITSWDDVYQGTVSLLGLLLHVSVSPVCLQPSHRCLRNIRKHQGWTTKQILCKIRTFSSSDFLYSDCGPLELQNLS